MVTPTYTSATPIVDQQNYNANPYYYPKQYSTINVIWINDPKYVVDYPVAQNCAVALWDYEHGYIYLKQADATGKPSVKTYSLTEEIKEEVNSSVDMNNYAKTESIDELKTMFKDLRKDLEQIKKDMYGLAGKKKSKKEYEED